LTPTVREGLSFIHQRRHNYGNREKKKFIEAIEDWRKKKGGRDTFSSYDEKRPTQAGKHTDLSLHMCEVWGKAGCAWPSRDVWEVNKVMLCGTRENGSKEQDPWPRSLPEATHTAPHK